MKLCAAFLMCIASLSAGSAIRADAARGRQLIVQFGCPACHDIPGIIGPRGRVGPPLAGLARRAYIAGVLPNQPAELERWLRDPQAMAPGTAMPNLGVDAAQAADIAAYLNTLN